MCMKAKTCLKVLKGKPFSVHKLFCTQLIKRNTQIGHFTVVCLVTWPWLGSEAAGDLF